jgi:hypothetical protein
MTCQTAIAGIMFTIRDIKWASFSWKLYKPTPYIQSIKLKGCTVEGLDVVQY